MPEDTGVLGAQRGGDLIWKGTRWGFAKVPQVVSPPTPRHTGVSGGGGGRGKDQSLDTGKGGEPGKFRI